MATITFKGSPISTIGTLPAKGARIPDFKLADASLNDVDLGAFEGKKKVINIVPSLDTGICAMSAKRFNQAAAATKDAVVLTISADLPFAQKRFCESEKITAIHTLSTFRAPAFGKEYGVLITAGPLAGLMSRAVIVVDRSNRVVYTEQVPEIAQEPNYDAALAALASA